MELLQKLYWKCSCKDQNLQCGYF